MKRREAVRIIRDVMSGRRRHDSARITLKKRGYEVYTSIGIAYTDHAEKEFVVRYICNKMTLQEADKVLTLHENYLTDKEQQ